MWYYLSLAAAILSGATGQLLLKGGASADTFLGQFLDPKTILGVFFYGLGAPFYIVALRQVPLSIAFPSVAASYIVVAMAGHFIWGEPLGAPQIAGLVLIASGVILLNQTWA